MIVICVIGEAGSGKSFVAKKIAEELKIKPENFIETSSIVKKIFNKQTRKDLNIASFREEQLNPDYLWDPLKTELDQIAANPGIPVVIISGVREPYVFMKLRDYVIDNKYFLHLVRTRASKFTRFERLCKRDNKRLSIEDFRAADKNAQDLGLDLIMEASFAHYRCLGYDVNNDTDPSPDINKVIFSVRNDYALMKGPSQQKKTAEAVANIESPDVKKKKWFIFD